MSSPVLSVVMPVYNAARHLRPAIESILNQSYSGFELIVIDDGSTDRTPALLVRYAEGDARIRVLRDTNKGLVPSLTKGCAAARGALIARMDGDDIACRTRFAAQVELLERRPDVVCVGGDVMLMDERGRYLTTLRMPREDHQIQAAALAGHTPIWHPTAMFRRAAYEQIGGYRAGAYPVEDLDLWLRLGEVGHLANVPQPVLAYRLHATSISGQAGQVQREQARAVCAEAWRRRGIQGRFDAGTPWRPGTDRQSRHEFSLRYGWWAYNSGCLRTAAVYGLKAITARPASGAGWRLFACALFKPRPRRAHGVRSA